MLKKGDNQKKKILICGAGAVGIFLGAMLSKNHEIELFGRKKLKEAGKEIIIGEKIFKISKRTFRKPEHNAYDIIFITTKLYDTDKIVNLLKKNKIHAKIISNVQNGVVDCRNYEKILKKRIIPVCVFGGFRIEKNKIFSLPTKSGWITKKSKEGIAISKILSENNIPCKPSKKFDSLRAEKMIVNCCLNALSAIEKKSFKELFSDKKTFKRINKLFDESYAILNREYALRNPEKMKKNMFHNWSKLNHYSSTYQDIKSGRKNEVNFFNGYLANLGEKNNLPVEENKRILKEIFLLEKSKPFKH